jgi:uncharacterized protein (DUF2342 family)
LVAAFCELPIAAQSPARLANTESRSAALSDLENVPEREKVRDRSASEKREREFVARLAEFAKAWNELIKLSEKGVWNPKQAKAAHQAFDRLVSSQGWIEGSKKIETAEK